jgi:hypothetical protein
MPLVAVDEATRRAIALERHDDRLRQTRATFAALAGLLEQYGLSDSERERVELHMEALADIVKLRHTAIRETL